MRTLNKVVFTCFLALGLTFAISWYMQLGGAMAVTMYFGWFLMAFGFVAYFIASVQHALRRFTGIWEDLYVANFGLALLAIAAIGLTHQRLVEYALISLAGVVLGIVASRMSIMRHRIAPLGLMIPLLAIFPWASAELGIWACLFIGAFSAVLALRMKAKQDTRFHAPTPTQ